MSKWRGMAVDLGASNGRTVLGEYDGGKVNLAEVSRFSNIPVNLGGTLYWDFLSLFKEVIAGLSKSSSQGKPPVTLGIDGWAVDFGLLDGNGELIQNPRHYRDHHNDDMMKEVFARIPGPTVYKRTGIQLMQINTIYQLMFLRLHRAALLEKAETLLLIPDLMNYFLTGTKIAEFTNVTTTQLFNPYLRTWDEALMSKLDLPSRILAPIVSPFQIIGPIRPDIVPGNQGEPVSVVTVGEHDTASAVFAVPYETENYAYISSGTWSLVGTVSEVPLITELTAKYNFTNEGGVNGNYRVLKNVMGLWLLQEVLRRFDLSGQNFSYSDLSALASKAQAFKYVIDPDASDFLAPVNMIETIQGYCLRTGQSRPSDPGEISRVILESLALKYRFVIGKLERVVGHPIEVVYLVGGGAHNELLCQMTADATHKPVLAGPVEATTIGNICAQLIAVQELKSAEVPLLVRNSFPPKVYLPQKDRSAWDQAYLRLLRLLGEAESQPEEKNIGLGPTVARLHLT